MDYKTIVYTRRNFKMDTKEFIMRAESEAFTSCSDKIVSTIQDSVLSISNGCLAKHLITDHTHKELLHGKDIPYKMATKLFEAVRNTMKTKIDVDVFKVFLSILGEEIGVIDCLIQCVERTKLDALQRMIWMKYREDIREMEIKKHKKMSKEQLNRWTVIEGNIPELTEVCKRYLYQIAIDCKLKDIISEEVRREVETINELKVIQTIYLLKNVFYAVRTDSRKFEIFMEILKKYTFCKEVVQKIEGSLSTTKVPHPKMEDRKVGASLGARKRSRSDTGVTESQQCDASQSSMVAIGPTLRQQPVSMSTRDREYSWHMERLQQQAQVDDLKEKLAEAKVGGGGEEKRVEEGRQGIPSLKEWNDTIIIVGLLLVLLICIFQYLYFLSFVIIVILGLFLHR